MKKLIFCFVCMLSVTVFGDGLPFDEKGNLEIPHVLIDLNESQKEELMVMDSVTLTKSQWKRVRQFSPNTSKRLQGILPMTWNDCTCGVSYDAVQMKTGKIAILKNEQFPKRLAWKLKGRQSLRFFVDKRGQFYLSGILVRFPNLLEAINLSEPYKSVDEEAVFYSHWV